MSALWLKRWLHPDSLVPNALAFGLAAVLGGIGLSKFVNSGLTSDVGPGYVSPIMAVAEFGIAVAVLSPACRLLGARVGAFFFGSLSVMAAMAWLLEPPRSCGRCVGGRVLTPEWRLFLALGLALWCWSLATMDRHRAEGSKSGAWSTGLEAG